ncbi:MAG: hypothetical protein EPN82_05665 [Bacteroidetes bacterium]|nr:MAG: hypothetical protein EPN82_05665 [Bacteroidota bacterium]
MSNNICPKVEIRGLGDNYGEILQVELVSVNKWSISVRFPEGGICRFSPVSGFDQDILEDPHANINYSGYQLNLKSLIFDETLMYIEGNDTVRPKNINHHNLVLENQEQEIV